jgi:hypothetical protein
MTYVSPARRDRKFFIRCALIFALPAFLILGSCEPGGESLNIAITLSPSNPVVIDVDFKLPYPNPNYTGAPESSEHEYLYENISKHWFKFSLNYTNNDPVRTITIVAFRIDFDTFGKCEFNTDTFFKSNPDENMGYIVALLPGESTSHANMYCHGLTFTEGETFIRNGVLTIVGWIGTPSQPEERLRSARVSFSTK